jgi:serine protease Do
MIVMGTGKREGVQRLTPVGILMACGLLLGACTGTSIATNSASSGASGLPSPNSLTSSPSSDPIVSVVQHVAPAVVNVTSKVVSVGAFGGAQEGQGVGTGFIIRSAGVIVTNFHVVETAVNIKVTLPSPDSRSFDARVIGGSDVHDLAVLKVDATGLPTVPLGDSTNLQLGQTVIALGYALALPGGPTVTSGIISSLARTVQASDPNAPGGVRTYQDALQTDAAINPGNSGGPLVDLAGNVVGINTAGNNQAENIGFAISIDAAKPDIEQAMNNPAAPVAYMGVLTQTLDSGLAAQFGLDVETGAWVQALTPGGPAEQAGFKQNDVIVSFDGKPVTSSDELGNAIAARSPGDQVTVEVVRGNQRLELKPTLGVRPLPTP